MIYRPEVFDHSTRAKGIQRIMSATVQRNLTAAAPIENGSRRARQIQSKHIFFFVCAVMTLFVLYRYETPFLDSQLWGTGSVKEEYS